MHTGNQTYFRLPSQSPLSPYAIKSLGILTREIHLHHRNNFLGGLRRGKNLNLYRNIGDLILKGPYISKGPAVWVSI